MLVKFVEAWFNPCLCHIAHHGLESLGIKPLIFALPRCLVTSTSDSDESVEADRTAGHNGFARQMTAAD